MTLLSILFSLTFALPQQPRRLQPPRPKPAVFRWYMTEQGHAIKCYGKPHLVIKDGELKLAATNCEGKFPEVLLKD